MFKAHNSFVQQGNFYTKGWASLSSGNMRRLILSRSTAIVVLACLLLAGCHGEHGDESTLPPDLQAVSFQTRDVVDWALTILLGDSVTGPGLTQAAGSEASAPDSVIPPGEVSVTVPCGQGHIAVTGSVQVEKHDAEEHFTIAASLTFAACDGSEGTLSFGSEGIVKQHDMAIEMTLDGSIRTEGCVLAFDQFVTDTKANRAGLLTAAILVTGSIAATCEDTHILCTPKGADIDNQERLANSCKPSSSS